MYIGDGDGVASERAVAPARHSLAIRMAQIGDEHACVYSAVFFMMHAANLFHCSTQRWSIYRRTYNIKKHILHCRVTHTAQFSTVGAVSYVLGAPLSHDASAIYHTGERRTFVHATQRLYSCGSRVDIHQPIRVVYSILCAFVRV